MAPYDFAVRLDAMAPNVIRFLHLFQASLLKLEGVSSRDINALQQATEFMSAQTSALLLLRQDIEKATKDASAPALDHAFALVNRQDVRIELLFQQIASLEAENANLRENAGEALDPHDKETPDELPA